MLILGVDDDALSRDLLALLLEAEEYEVEVAASGAEAVSMIGSCVREGRSLPDVVLTDLQMPGLAGNDLAEALRAAAGRTLLILAMSASRPMVSALIGFDGFLMKPFKVSELKAMVSAAQRLPEKETVAAEPRQEIAEVDASGSDALHEEIYAKMCELMPVEQLGQMYALCVDDARKRIVHMQSLAAVGHDVEYRKEAHAVKGGCGMIGAKELYTLAANAEQTGLVSQQSATGTTSVTALLAQLSRACDRLERILQERMRE